MNLHRILLPGVAMLAIVLPITGTTEAADQRSWKKLNEDGLHDATLESVSVLQEPAESLGALPFDYTGNQVDWARALKEGAITPRSSLLPDTEVRVLDLDIVFGRTGEAGLVRFPHKAHTEWLDCVNCHDSIFEQTAGATKMSMMAILNGEYCGVCHGAVSFPLTECNRCHSIPRKSFKGKFGAQPTLEN